MREGYRELGDMQASDPCYMVSDELLDLYGSCNQTMVQQKTNPGYTGLFVFRMEF